MLSMSVADEAELETWRSRYGRCRLPPEKMRPQAALDITLERLPISMSRMLQSRLHAGGWLGALRLEAAQIAEIESSARMQRQELMVMLLDVASSLAKGVSQGEHIGAIAEGNSGAFYVGAPLSWSGSSIKFSVHGAQAAVLNALNHGEEGLRQLMVEVQPCACCRQFLRELLDWKTLKILQAVDGPLSLKGNIKTSDLALDGLRSSGIRAKLMGEPKRSIALSRSPSDLVRQAADAAAYSYAPYSRNYAGVSLRTKRGLTHQGCYVETRESVAGVLAIETALADLNLAGSAVSDIEEIILVETRGTVTQFPATQKLVRAMGNVSFRFMMAE